MQECEGPGAGGKYQTHLMQDHLPGFPTEYPQTPPHDEFSPKTLIPSRTPPYRHRR